MVNLIMVYVSMFYWKDFFEKVVSVNVFFNLVSVMFLV